MKNKSKTHNCFCLYLTAALLAISPGLLFAHDIIVHEEITANAIASANDLSLGYQNFYNLILNDADNLSDGVITRSAISWIIVGSGREDNYRIDPVDGSPDAGGIRSYNHFYDPVHFEANNQNKLGLSDFPFFGFQSPPMGHNSFDWASERNESGIDFQSRYDAVRNVNTFNYWSWQNARDYEIGGLTSSSSVARRANLAAMYRAIGQVIHLLEDASQPQHVRDEQHLDKPMPVTGATPWLSPIEKYGSDNFPKLNYQHGMLDWRTAGFKKLEDFWDRGFYNGTSAQPLIDSEDINQPAKELGLAEWCNGNFIGDRHTYSEIIPAGNPFHYPYPSLNNGTDWNLLRANPAAYGKPTSLGIVGAGLRYIVAKTGQGRQVPYHGAVSYLVAANSDLALDPGLYSASVDDPDVLKSYHDILIPEAIKYSAGLLDYFFRGRLEVSDGYVLNISGQSLAFSGGAFYFYKEDSAGIRTLVHTIPLTTVLNSGDGIPITIPETPNSWVSTDQIVVVYKGNIGIGSGGTPNDPVDTDVAIAVLRYSVFPNEVGMYLQFLDCFNDYTFHETPAGIFYSANSTGLANNWVDEWAAAQYPDECFY